MNIFMKTLLLTLIFISQILPQGYKLVWSDEFSDTTLDLSKWSYETGGGGWGNSESEYYTNRTDNCILQNGYLNIIARKESYSGYNYTSARIKTQGKFSVKYGKIEARMRLPRGKGIWPAFWMLGDNISTVGWPKCGETDIMEMIGGSGTGSTGNQVSDSKIYGTLHWDSNGHVQAGGNYSLSSGKFADDFHLIGIIWNSQKVQFYVDNTIYYTYDISSAALNAFQNKFFIILNLAVGGQWPGYPDSTTVFSQIYQIDYVRVYEDTAGTTNTINDKTKKPLGFKLYQNYPNPFNPTTEISWQLAASSFVTLKIYDVLGNVVTTLVSEEESAGIHTAIFNSQQATSRRQLASGIYYYHILAGNFTDTKKLILFK